MFMNMLWIKTAILGANKLAKAMINAFSGISFYKFANTNLMITSVNLWKCMACCSDVLTDKLHPRFLTKFWVKRCSFSAGVYGNTHSHHTCKWKFEGLSYQCTIKEKVFLWNWHTCRLWQAWPATSPHAIKIALPKVRQVTTI